MTTTTSPGVLDPFALSQQLADVVEELSPSLLSVHAGRRRLSATAWSADLAVTTLRALRPHAGRGRGRGPFRRHGRHPSRHHGHRHEHDHHENTALPADLEVTVALPGGETRAASVVGHDPSTDLVVLSLPGGGLTPAPWADTDGVRVGNLVLVLGRPGATTRATWGMVSGTAGAFQTALGGQIDRYLQVDATLNPGMVGGLLTDLRGRALGLNTDGLVQGGVTIPTETIRRVVGALLQHGKLQRGYLGVGVQPATLPAEAAEAAGQPQGLVVVSVEADSPAAEAGITVGDILLTLDEAPLSHLAQLVSALGHDQVGQAKAIGFLRGGVPFAVEVTVAPRP